MAKDHWFHDEAASSFGCQHSRCKKPASMQWQRQATEAEVAGQQGLQGPYGDLYRNPEGPHVVAVFSCENHALHPDAMATTHHWGCPAPDKGCECHGS